MTEKSYLWTTGGAGDGASTYSRSDWGKVAKILAACRGFEGVAPGYLNKLAASVVAANTVRVATGGAVVDGKPYDSSAAVDVNIPSVVGAGNTRIDRIVLRASWAAQTVRVTRIAGTDAASPTVPAITQTSETTYDIMLCQALVDVGGTVTITDERVWAEIGSAIITNAMIAASAVAETQIATDAVTTSKILALNVTGAKIAAAAITVDKIAVNAVETAQIKDANVTSAKLAQPKPYSCRAKNSGIQSIPDAQETVVNLGAEDFDSDTMHALVTNNSRIVCKRAGRYFVYAKCLFAAPGANQLFLYKNGSFLLILDDIIGGFCLQGADYVELAVNDYLQLKVIQFSASAINLNTASFSVVWDG